jgi:hypothetical protein
VTAEQVWRLLGIAPTHDRAAIRSAYADALKAIDVDADPQAFMALRQAREEAIALAASLVAQADGAVEHGDAGGVPTEAEVPNSGPQDPEQVARMEHQQALITLLLPGDDIQASPLTQEEVDAANTHFAALSRDIQLSNVEIFGDASEWFAELLARGSPRSDPLLDPVAAFFGWTDEADISASPALAFAIGRRAAIRYRASLAAKQHPLHRAWAEITRPATERSRRGWVRRRKMAELLGTIRSRYPTLENEFDWYRAQLWEHSRPRFGINLGLIFFILWFGFQIVRSTSQHTPEIEQPSHPAQPTLVSSGADIDVALDAEFGDTLTALDLSGSNPELYKRLVQLWDAAVERRTSRSLFIDDVRNFLEPRITASIAVAPASIQARAIALQLERAQTARNAGWTTCAAWVGTIKYPMPLLNLPEDWEKRHKQVVADALQAAPARTVDQLMAAHNVSRFSIPADQFQDMLSKSGLSRETLQSGLLDKGNEQQRCRAKLALLEVATLAKGPTGIALRRHMLGGS